jgi:2-polyprenyl-3-methyl-5-hydroxy-6-metoxy-1,4-benzoquinol methylase
VTASRSIAQLFDESAERFDAIYSGAAGPRATLWDRLTRRNLRRRFDFTMRALAPAAGARVLDVGCGPGRYCVELARQGAETVGLDVSPRMLEIARSLAAEAAVADRCRFVQADVMDYGPRRAGGFDAVIAMGFFDYIADQEAVMRRLAELSRGRVIASFPCRRSLRAPLRRLWWRRRGWQIAFSSRQDVQRLCAACGLRPRRLLRDGPLLLLEAEPVPASPERAD